MSKAKTKKAVENIPASIPVAVEAPVVVPENIPAIRCKVLVPENNFNYFLYLNTRYEVEKIEASLSDVTLLPDEKSTLDKSRQELTAKMTSLLTSFDLMTMTTFDKRAIEILHSKECGYSYIVKFLESDKNFDKNLFKTAVKNFASILSAWCDIDMDTKNVLYHTKVNDIKQSAKESFQTVIDSLGIQSAENKQYFANSADVIALKLDFMTLRVSKDTSFDIGTIDRLTTILKGKSARSLYSRIEALILAKISTKGIVIPKK